MREEVNKTLFVTAMSVVALLFCFSPFVWQVVVSFSSSGDFLAGQAFGFTFRNYADLFTDNSFHFLSYVRNSLIVSGASALFCVLVSSLAAYAITRLQFRGKLFIILFVLALSMFPQISIVGYLYKLMNALGWINSYPALMLPYISLGLPLSLWILLTYFSQIPREIDRAALVDGANHAQVLFKIILPLAMPGLLSATLLVFIFSFNEFLFALMLTTDYRAATLPVGIAQFQGLHGEIPWGTIMAASTLASIPVVVLVVFFQRHIIQGLTTGAVKG